MKAEINLGNGLYEVGGHYDMGKCVMALYFNNVDMSYAYAPSVPWQPGYDQKIDLFMAKSINEMTLGLQLSLYGDSYLADADSARTETALTGFGLNLGATLVENLELFLSINMVSWTDKGADGEDKTSADGYLDFGLGGRYWMEMSGNYTLIPYLTFFKTGQGYKVENVPSDAPDGTVLGGKTSGINIMLGAGIYRKFQGTPTKPLALTTGNTTPHHGESAPFDRFRLRVGQQRSETCAVKTRRLR